METPHGRRPPGCLSSPSLKLTMALHQGEASGADGPGTSSHSAIGEAADNRETHGAEGGGAGATYVVDTSLAPGEGGCQAQPLGCISCREAAPLTPPPRCVDLHIGGSCGAKLRAVVWAAGLDAERHTEAQLERNLHEVRISSHTASLARAAWVRVRKKTRTVVGQRQSRQAGGGSVSGRRAGERRRWGGTRAQ